MSEFQKRGPVALIQVTLEEAEFLATMFETHYPEDVVGKDWRALVTKLEEERDAR